jgi:hypothetical protein
MQSGCNTVQNREEQPPQNNTNGNANGNLEYGHVLPFCF